jgi:hypothetical protein
MALLSRYADGGGYKDPEGCWHEDATSLLQAGLLRFCGCGRAEDNLRYILRGLEMVATYATGTPDYSERSCEVFGASEAEYFFYYWADKEGLTEHGGTVPGWLTEKGKTLLAMLREWSVEEAKVPQ